jgi:hypothetical protein
MVGSLLMSAGFFPTKVNGHARFIGVLAAGFGSLDESYV